MTRCAGAWLWAHGRGCVRAVAVPFRASAGHCVRVREALRARARSICLCALAVALAAREYPHASLGLLSLRFTRALFPVLIHPMPNKAVGENSQVMLGSYRSNGKLGE